MNDFNERGLSRRRFLTVAGLGAVATVAGCASSPNARISSTLTAYADGTPSVDPKYLQMYGQMVDNGIVIPAVDLRRVPERFLRREVDNPTGEKPGTVVVDTTNKFAYLTLPNGRAMRYGVGVGREGFGWSGRAKVQAKKTWPTWTPPSEMIGRKPELAEYADGMPGGIINPLGARAMYLFQNNRDTLYRLHGSPEYWTIGTADSSGCIRFMNQDIIDLYSRVPAGTPVVVRSGAYVA
ncbi:L,D-transpeptidase [Jiella sp. MQZ9-1]|uniref:L,D-transpeptidase n=1 Tax=Jiella flava TaxID=2816857 RepID=A0A939JRW1_9HYPH|nr:L,D-transpeptidase [Jiella flava]MBO0662328.1 L,D-transpeptidase [Jiella flava]MCD2470843.1 L,D-transpeptidase [Jiella flava]